MNTIYKFSLLAPIGILNLSLLSFSALAATTTAETNTATSPDFSGTYTCSYHDPMSNPIEGTETITIKQTGDLIKVTQTAKDNATPYGFGIGIVNKNIKNAFSYVYWLPKTPTSTNLQFFVVKSDGSLDGVVAQSNRNKSGTETCTKSSF